MVHVVLKRAIEMWERLCTGGEAHVFAQVVSSLGAVGAVVAHDASLDRDALADDEVLDTWTDGSDDTSGLVAEDEGCLEETVGYTMKEDYTMMKENQEEMLFLEKKEKMKD